MTNKTTFIRHLILALIAIPLFSNMGQAKVVTEGQAEKIAGQLFPVKGKKLARKHLLKADRLGQTFTPYYIFTGEDGKGFAIIAGDDVVRPILGYSADAELTPDDQLPVPMEQWLTSIGNQIRQAQDRGLQQSSDVAKQWKAPDIGDAIVKLTTAEWGQDAPLNNMCPFDQGTKSLTGCVPTAYAILMKYYGYPSTGKGRTSKYVTPTSKLTVAARNLEHAYEWDKMPDKFINGKYTSQQASIVARLMADIGAALQVDYTKSNTNGYLGRGTLFANFDYFPGTCRLKDAYDSGEWEDMMRNELDMKRPVMYRAADTETGGHAFLLDGYTDYGYFSVNWGWYGSYNGFFTLDALTPGNNYYSSGQVAYLNTIPMSSCNVPFEVQINGQDYPTLTAVFDEASSEGIPPTITLLSDVQVEVGNIASDKDITLDVGDRSIRFLSGINNYGNLTVKGTDESILEILGNNAIFNNYGSLDISGGTYKSVSTIFETNDYRRCVWTAQGSSTHISNVCFEGPSQVVCTNGRMIIESGTFTCTGNNATVSNYCVTDSLIIRGGTFQNTSANSSHNYRRCLWTTQNSNNFLGRAAFINKYGSQTLCFNGDATINGAVIENEKGRYGCSVFSNAIVVIDDCKLKANTLFYTDSGSQIFCKGGLFSSKVSPEFLAEEYECVTNTQAETKVKYPYVVQEGATGIASFAQQKDCPPMHIFNSHGIPQPSLQKGINIIRMSDGTSRKVMVK